jgi:hypothetical protein
VSGRADLLPKRIGETKTYVFDFSSDLAVGETISSATVTATVYSGTDASPSSILSGSDSTSGAVVSQNITAGTLGVIYELICAATTSLNQVLQQVGLLAIIPDEP